MTVEHIQEYHKQKTIMKRPEDFGYRNWCEMYDDLKAKGVNNQTVFLKRMEANGTVNTHTIRMATVERNAWREIAELMYTYTEANVIMQAIRANDFMHDKLKDKTYRLLKLFHKKFV